MTINVWADFTTSGGVKVFADTISTGSPTLAYTTSSSDPAYMTDTNDLSVSWAAQGDVADVYSQDANSVAIVLTTSSISPAYMRDSNNAVRAGQVFTTTSSNPVYMVDSTSVSSILGSLKATITASASIEARLSPITGEEVNEDVIWKRLFNKRTAISILEEISKTLRPFYVTSTVRLRDQVPNGSVIEFPYPTGTSQATAWLSEGHAIVDRNGSSYEAPAEITVSFGALTVSVTNLSGRTLLPGEQFTLQLLKETD